MKRRLLIVSPRFHGYARSIGQAFASLGYEVAVHAYDAADLTPISALLNRVQQHAPELLGDLIAERAAERAIKIARRVNADRILIIKGDRLGGAWWEYVRSSNSRGAVWFYDELRRMSYSVDAIGQLDIPFATYSASDARTLDAMGKVAHHIPLGYDHLTPFQPMKVNAVTFIGARYVNREQLLLGIQSRGVNVCAIGRDWSKHPWDMLRTQRFTSPDVSSRREVDRAGAYGIMAGSIATLNTHFDQDGFTMRTFEAAGVGAVQLIDRDDVSEYLEPEREVLVFHTADEAADHAARIQREPATARRIRERARKRTLEQHTLVQRAMSLEMLWA